jgi:hypothetical protein
MKSKATGTTAIVIGLLLLTLAGAYGVHAYVKWKRSEDRLAIWHMVRSINRPDFNETGYWVGDVSELHRLWKVPREMAEADVAPLHPLVPSPIPYHGYFVRALETGPTGGRGDDDSLSLKGKTRCRETFAICIYPVEEGSAEDIWLLCPFAIFRRKGRPGPPLVRWPTGKEILYEWGIVD